MVPSPANRMSRVCWRKLLSNREQFWGARRAEMSTRRAVFSKAACGNQLIMSICFAPFPLRRQTRFGKGQKVAGNGPEMVRKRPESGQKVAGKGQKVAGAIRKIGSERARKWPEMVRFGNVVRKRFGSEKVVRKKWFGCTSPVILEN